MIFISLIISDVEYLFIYLLPICMSPLGNIYSAPLPIFNWVFVFYWVVWVVFFFFFYIFNVNSLSDKWFANIFFHSLGHLFILFMISFAVQKFFGLMESHSFTLSSVAEIQKNPLTRPVSRSLPSVTLSRSCMVSDLMFKVYSFWVDFLMYNAR